ncbi:hypothetical protein KM043_006529 [Ampulex compressa]|nr:hypothetical protein KM043_006529 [Ampulex compressa]
MAGADDPWNNPRPSELEERFGSLLYSGDASVVFNDDSFRTSSLEELSRGSDVWGLGEPGSAHFLGLFSHSSPEIMSSRVTERERTVDKHRGSSHGPYASWLCVIAYLIEFGRSSKRA